MEHVSPKHVQSTRRYQEAIHGHPQPIGKSDQGERDDEVGEESCHQHHERFGCDEVQEEPHDVDEERVCSRAEVDEPVCDEREGDCDADYEVYVLAEQFPGVLV